MTNRPIDLGGRRTSKGKLQTDLRRRAANSLLSPDAKRNRADAEIDAAMLAEPSRTWMEAMEKVRFLLERYSMSPDARDVKLQKLIKRALSDLARLKKREESSS